jgi:hypothetical protein
MLLAVWCGCAAILLPVLATEQLDVALNASPALRITAFGNDDEAQAEMRVFLSMKTEKGIEYIKSLFRGSFTSIISIENLFFLNIHAKNHLLIDTIHVSRISSFYQYSTTAQPTSHHGRC